MTPPHFHRPALRASALALGLSLAFGATAQGTAPAADERAALTELRNTTLGLIEALVEQGLLTRAKADELLRRARASAAAPTASAETAAPGWGQPARPVVRVPYLSETARAQIKEDVRNDVLATARDEGWTDGRRLPGWVRSIVVDGDLRVRAQGEAFDENNAAADLFALQNITQESPAWAPDLTNTQHDRSRLTARARIGVTAKMSDTTSAGVRLATGGSSGSPASESQTLSGDFNRWGVGFDRAWLQWEPVQGRALRPQRSSMARRPGARRRRGQGRVGLRPGRLRLRGRRCLPAGGVRQFHSRQVALRRSARRGLGFGRRRLAVAQRAGHLQLRQA
jgi:hypothetical protein